jgi:DNA-binding transcriptional LysR family regulator
MFKIGTTQASSFMVACEETSIRSASERLGLEPSTISRQIKALEASLDIILIERGRKGVRPTEAGEILLEYLKRQRGDQETLLTEFNELSGLRRGELVIAVGEGFISDFIGNALTPYNSAYPGLTYDLIRGSTDQVLHAVLTDRAHIGLAFNARRDRSIRTVVRVKQPLKVLVSPSSIWAKIEEPISMRQLQTLPCAVLTKGFGVGDMIREVEAIYETRLQTIVRSNSLDVLRNFVREGLGVTILPAFVVTRDIADGTIMTKTLDIPQLSKGETSILTRNGRRLPEGAKRLVDHLIPSMAAFTNTL